MTSFPLRPANMTAAGMMSKLHKSMDESESTQQQEQQRFQQSVKRQPMKIKQDFAVQTDPIEDEMNEYSTDSDQSNCCDEEDDEYDEDVGVDVDDEDSILAVGSKTRPNGTCTTTTSSSSGSNKNTSSYPDQVGAWTKSVGPKKKIQPNPSYFMNPNQEFHQHLTTDSNKRHSLASLDSSRDSTYATGSESSNGVTSIPNSLDDSVRSSSLQYNQPRNLFPMPIKRNTGEIQDPNFRFPTHLIPDHQHHHHHHQQHQQQATHTATTLSPNLNRPNNPFVLSPILNRFKYSNYVSSNSTTPSPDFSVGPNFPKYPEIPNQIDTDSLPSVGMGYNYSSILPNSGTQTDHHFGAGHCANSKRPQTLVRPPTPQRTVTGSGLFNDRLRYHRTPSGVLPQTLYPNHPNPVGTVYTNWDLLSPECAQMIQWLHSVGFHRFSDSFVNAGFDMWTLSRATPEELNACGITNPRDRQLIRSELSRLHLSDPLTDHLPPNVQTWLSQLNLDIYWPKLKNQGLSTYEQIGRITLEDLEEIGITKLGHQKKFTMAIGRLKRLLMEGLVVSNDSNADHQQNKPCSPASYHTMGSRNPCVSHPISGALHQSQISQSRDGRPSNSNQEIPILNPHNVGSQISGSDDSPLPSPPPEFQDSPPDSNLNQIPTRLDKQPKYCTLKSQLPLESKSSENPKQTCTRIGFGRRGSSPSILFTSDERCTGLLETPQLRLPLEQPVRTDPDLKDMNDIRLMLDELSQHLILTNPSEPAKSQPC